MEFDPAKAPNHVAVIMDGNGRWAIQRGWERLKGHKQGVERVREIVQACPDLGVKHLTVFAFSTENWSRSEKEVSGLMSLFRQYIRSESKRLHANGARVRFIGDRSKLSNTLQKLMGELEELTKDNSFFCLTIAVNYGGRDEIKRASQRLAAEIQSGAVQPSEITEATITSFMDTAGLPDVDFVIRTSGEVRVSNFLPWQAAYAEYAFLPIPWPDFTPEVFKQTLADYATRQRRFGAEVAK